MVDVESTILSLADDQGVLFPGTGDWDFTKERTILPASRPLQQHDINELFDDQDRLPIEISLDNSSKTQTVAASTVSFENLMNVGEAYSDVLLLPTHDIQMAGVDVTRTVPDPVKPLSQKRWQELIALAGSSSRDVEGSVISDDESEASNILHAEEYKPDGSLLSDDDEHVVFNANPSDGDPQNDPGFAKTDPVQGKIKFVDENEIVTPDGQPLRLGDLGVVTPVRSANGEPAFRRGAFYG